MIAVIQCAGGKRPGAGHLRTCDGQKVMFVANPDRAPEGESHVYARPDDISDTGKSWRTVLREYNEDPGDNRHGLFPAWQLYKHPTYKILADHCGLDRLYILSAGWGLIPAAFLTPKYDITFSAARNVASFKRRNRSGNYRDFRMLPPDVTDQIAFFGGKSYVSFFCQLTSDVKGPRHLFCNSIQAPVAPDCALQRFYTRTRTNWHYECAKAFVEGGIQLESG